MHWIDIVILILIGVSAISGFFKGFILSVASLAGFVLGIFLSLRYAAPVEELLKSATGSDAPYLHIAAFLLCFAVVAAVIFLLGKVVEKVIKNAELGFLNRLAGAGFCIIKVLVFFVILFHLIEVVDSNQIIIKPETRQRSVFFNPLAAYAPTLLPFLKDHMDKLKEKIADEENHQEVSI